MSEKQIVVEIAPDGKITIRAEGYTGPGCVEAVKRYAVALGVEVEAANLPEFYLTADEDSELITGGDAGW